jgi:hypothetical protein
MKYLLMIYRNDATWESLSEAERNEVFRGHDEFIKTVTASGEMIGTEALANPSTGATVRVRDGVTVVSSDVSDRPYHETNETKEYLAGYYLVDCESRDRAIELAAMIPDARFSAVRVQPIMDTAGLEM